MQLLQLEPRNIPAETGYIFTTYASVVPLPGLTSFLEIQGSEASRSTKAVNHHLQIQSNPRAAFTLALNFAHDHPL